MSANTDNPTGQPQSCGDCIKMIGNSDWSGHCYHNPPAVFANGFSARPPVGRHDPACTHFVQAAPAAPLSNDQVN